MHDLRFIGVHETGEHLLLADDDGTRFLLPIDEALRGAARPIRPAAARRSPLALTARDVQALIRSGVSAEEVSERSGWPAGKVASFGGPVLAERAYIATRARDCRLRARAEATGSEPLYVRVERRLSGRGVQPSEAEWDATRDESGVWAVHVAFPAGGRTRRASWRFDHAAEAVEAIDDEALWLSAEEPVDGPLQDPPLPGERVFDVEAVGGVAERPGPPPTVTTRVDQTDALMAAIREHSHAGDRGGARTSAHPAPGDQAGDGTRLTTGQRRARRRSARAAAAQAAGNADVIADQLPTDDLPAEPPIEELPREQLRLDDLEQLRLDDVRDEEPVTPQEPVPTQEPVASQEPVPAEERVTSQELAPDEELAFDNEPVPTQEPDPTAAHENGRPVPAMPARSADGAKRKVRIGVPDWNDVMFGPSCTDSR